ncbi:beta-xylosidase family glycoside hydrolase [Enterobacter hormaechei]
MTAARLTLNCRLCAFRFDDALGSLTARPGYSRLYGNDSLNSTFTQSTVARRWQHFIFPGRDADAVLAGSLPAERGADLLLQQQKLELLLCGLRGGAGAERLR